MSRCAWCASERRAPSKARHWRCADCGRRVRRGAYNESLSTGLRKRAWAERAARFDRAPLTHPLAPAHLVLAYLDAQAQGAPCNKGTLTHALRMAVHTIDQGKPVDAEGRLLPVRGLQAAIAEIRTWAKVAANRRSARRRDRASTPHERLAEWFLEISEAGISGDPAPYRRDPHHSAYKQSRRFKIKGYVYHDDSGDDAEIGARFNRLWGPKGGELPANAGNLYLSFPRRAWVRDVAKRGIANVGDAFVLSAVPCGTLAGRPAFKVQCLVPAPRARLRVEIRNAVLVKCAEGALVHAYYDGERPSEHMLRSLAKRARHADYTARKARGQA